MSRKALEAHLWPDEIFMQLKKRPRSRLKVSSSGDSRLMGSEARGFGSVGNNDKEEVVAEGEGDD